MPDRPPVRSLRPLGVTAAAAVVSVGLLALAIDQGWLGPDVGRGDMFCEAARDGFLVQPANSLSNLGFVVAGLLVAWRAGRPDQLGDVLPRLPALPTAFAVVTVLLGPASAAMHATQSALGGHLDLLSMYLIASFAAAYAAMRLLRRRATFFFQVFLLLVAACELVGTYPHEVPVVHMPGNLAFGVLLIAAVVMEILLWRRAERHPDRPALRRRGRGHHGRGLRDLEPGPGSVVRPALAAPGTRRVAPARRGGGVPAVPALRQRAGHGPLRSGHFAVDVAAAGGSLTSGSLPFRA